MVETVYDLRRLISQDIFTCLLLYLVFDQCRNDPMTLQMLHILKKSEKMYPFLTNKK